MNNRSETLSFFREALDLLTEMTADYVIEDLCQGTNLNFSTYVLPNLHPGLQKQCETIDDLYELDLNPLFAVCRNVKGPSRDLNLIDDRSMFYGYISLVQQIRNKISHMSSKENIGFIMQFNWATTLYLLIREYPKEARERKSYKELRIALEDFINSVSQHKEETNTLSSSRVVQFQNEDNESQSDVINNIETNERNTLYGTDEDKNKRISKLEKLQREIWSSHPRDRLTQCVLTREILKIFTQFILTERQIDLDHDSFAELVGTKKFQKISSEQLVYIESINNILNER